LARGPSSGGHGQQVHASGTPAEIEDSHIRRQQTCAFSPLLEHCSRVIYSDTGQALLEQFHAAMWRRGLLENPPRQPETSRPVFIAPCYVRARLAAGSESHFRRCRRGARPGGAGNPSHAFFRGSDRGEQTAWTGLPVCLCDGQGSRTCLRAFEAFWRATACGAAMAVRRGRAAYVVPSGPSARSCRTMPPCGSGSAVL
jgi:hypothetical protein